jgi:glycosyltransferase involved in cell wall biosynthesis
MCEIYQEVNKRKILVFAHVPPPHHGQSVMVQIMLDGLRADPRFEVHHVDARVSDDLEDVGSFRPQKFLRLFKCILQAWWIRLRHGRMAFYYVPAPAKRSAIMRDWVVMALCRPPFPELILHWHAYGLGEWVAAGNDWPRKLTRRALGKADLSIVLTAHNRPDAEVFRPKRCLVVANGIADPCPDFSETVLPLRMKRRAVPADEREVRCLFMAQCTRAKGLFDALEAFAVAKAASGQKRRLHLTVAGKFVDLREEQLLWDRVKQADLQEPDGAPAVEFVGFLDMEAKSRALRDHDCLLVPSHWESFGLSVIEAAAYGLPVVISEQPNLKNLLPSSLTFSAPCQDAEKYAEGIIKSFQFDRFSELRKTYLEKYQSDAFARAIVEALIKT